MELRFLMLIWVIILMKILLARENNIKQNENKNKMLNRLSFLSENDDPQKYKDDRESKVIRSGNRQSGITYWVNIRSKLGANAYRPFAKD